jgi:hypothetical protein
MNNPDVLRKVQIFLNFKYPSLRNSRESDLCSYDIFDWERHQEWDPKYWNKVIRHLYIHILFKKAAIKVKIHRLWKKRDPNKKHDGISSCWFGNVCIHRSCHTSAVSVRVSRCSFLSHSLNLVFHMFVYSIGSIHIRKYNRLTSVLIEVQSCDKNSVAF